MKKDSIIDYLACISLRVGGPIIRRLPLGFSLFLGACLGELFYYLDLKHRAIAYANIKTAFADTLSPSEIKSLSKDFYRTFGQNLMEIFFIPLINKEYINKYIDIQGLNYINEGFKKGKGVILVGIHEGGWELSGVICANIGFPFNLFVRDQRHPRLERLLNLYRRQKGGKLIQRQDQTRQLIQALKDNEAIGMTADQGGRDGRLVKFLGKDASMPSGAIRLALEYDAPIIPSFYIRRKGPYIKIILGPPLKINRTGNKDTDIQNNLQELIHLFERHILRYPREYLWSYRIWKYAKERNILILSDGKTGHLRQSQALTDIIGSFLKDKGINTHIATLDIKFKNKFSRYALTFSGCLAGKYQCQGCLWCLRTFLKEDTYKSLIARRFDIVISCGSSLAAVNFVISRENQAKSIVIMRPSVLSTNRFDLVIMSRHDKPLRRKNIAITEGALNLIDEEYLREQSEKLQTTNYKLQATSFYIGLLIGGDTKDFSLNKDTMRQVLEQVKLASERLNANILVSTSRRTTTDIERLVKEEFKDYLRCRLLVIANEKNLPFAVGGILALSKIVIVSPESISMVCEAASSNRYIIVFKSQVNSRHNYFLNNMFEKKYIYLCEPNEVSSVVERLWKEQSKINVLNDRVIVEDALKRIL